MRTSSSRLYEGQGGRREPVRDSWIRLIRAPESDREPQDLSGRSEGTRVFPSDRHLRGFGDDRPVDDLVRSAADGDRDAWNMLVDRFSGTVWAIARGHRLSSVDAADVSQTTWMRLMEHLDRIEHPERVGAWLAMTARRESLRLIRLSIRQVPSGDNLREVPDPAASVTEGRCLDTDRAVKVLAELVKHLPIRSQLLLRLLMGDTPLSYKDISDALDMPIGSIGPTRARALAQLRHRAARSGINLRDLAAM